MIKPWKALNTETRIFLFKIITEELKNLKKKVLRCTSTFNVQLGAAH